jgi:hypothetical protein
VSPATPPVAQRHPLATLVAIEKTARHFDQRRDTGRCATTLVVGTVTVPGVHVPPAWAGRAISAQHCSSVYPFLKFVFHLKFPGNSFKVKTFIENEIELRKI